MLTIITSPKGGSGVSVCAAAIAGAANAVLVDLDGDQPALLGTRPAEESILRDAAHAAAVASDATAAAQRVLANHGRDDLTVDVLPDGQLLHITLRNNNGDGVGTVSVAVAPP